MEGIYSQIRSSPVWKHQRKLPSPLPDWSYQLHHFKQKQTTGCDLRRHRPAEAFDLIDHTTLIKSMTSLGFHEGVVKWIAFIDLPSQRTRAND